MVFKKFSLWFKDLAIWFKGFLSWLSYWAIESPDDSKKKAPKSWRKEFIRTLPGIYLGRLESEKADRKRNDESSAVAAGAGTKYEDQVRFVELNTKPKPSDCSKLTLAKAIGQHLKDWTGYKIPDRTIERRLTAFGITDKK